MNYHLYFTANPNVAVLFYDISNYSLDKMVKTLVRLNLESFPGIEKATVNKRNIKLTKARSYRWPTIFAHVLYIFSQRVNYGEEITRDKPNQHFWKKTSADQDEWYQSAEEDMILDNLITEELRKMNTVNT